jgi:hypothetical protein
MPVSFDVWPSFHNKAPRYKPGRDLAQTSIGNSTSARRPDGARASRSSAVGDAHQEACASWDISVVLYCFEKSPRATSELFEEDVNDS